MRLLALALVLLSTTAHAAPEDYGGAYVIFARGDALFRTDPKGKTETELVKLAPRTGEVRALRTDALGKVLLVNVGHHWAWMPLDGKATTLTDLPCADGPAQLATDGACVLCRSATNATGSVIVNLATGRQTPVAIPAPGARLVGSGAERRLVWADTGGVWSAPPGDPRRKKQVAPEAPLRGFSPSPDGSRAIGVYLDKIHDSVKTTKPAEMLMSFALDGVGARRKGIKSGVAAEWSHDNQWVLVQDRGSACIMSATGGQYKCWKGFTAASIASDGTWALLLGSREKAAPAKSKKEPKKKKKKKDKDEPTADAEPENKGGEDDAVHDDVEVPPPAGPLAVYRAALEGAYTKSPARIVSNVDGTAVWVPGPSAPAPRAM